MFFVMLIGFVSRMRITEVTRNWDASTIWTGSSVNSFRIEFVESSRICTKTGHSVHRLTASLENLIDDEEETQQDAFQVNILKASFMKPAWTTFTEVSESRIRHKTKRVHYRSKENPGWKTKDFQSRPIKWNCQKEVQNFVLILKSFGSGLFVSGKTQDRRCL